MVRKYTDLEILKAVKSLPSFAGIPTNFWICGIRSKNDISDKYDDKFYLFKNEQFIMRTTGTTNPGKTGLLKPVNEKGCAVVKSNQWYYDLWERGMHKGKMVALVQAHNVLYYRDNDKDLSAEETGSIQKGIIGINFHTCTYITEKQTLESIKGENIGLWSEGCQVCNIPTDYYHILDKVALQKYVSYCLLLES